MALLWCDGFGNVDGEEEQAVYGYDSPGPYGIEFGAYGRNGRGAAVLKDSDQMLIKDLPSNHSTLIVGVAIKPIFYEGLGHHPLILFKDGGTTQAYMTIYTTDLNNYTVHAYRGDGTLLGSGTVSFMHNVWHYFEIKVLFSATVGTIEIRVNETDEAISLTGQNTINTANAYANQAELRGVDEGANAHIYTTYFGDYYICDGSGATNNNFLGDSKVDTHLPNSDGIYEDFTCSTGSDMFAMLDETDPDDDTTYIESSTVGHQYTCGQATPTDGTTIYGVMLRQKVKNTDAGTMKVKQLLRNNATDTLGGTELTLSASWQYLHGVYEADPSDSAAWQDADFSTAEFGLEITA